MTMQELGEILRSARLGKGLTLEDVNKETKISMFVLDVLEKGEGGRLPHPVYTKGFLRGYASLLGLDAEKLVSEYLAALGPVETIHIDTGVPDLNVRRCAQKTNKSVWGAFVLLLLLVGGVWAAISYLSQEVVPVIAVIEDVETGNETEASAMESHSQTADDLTKKGVSENAKDTAEGISGMTTAQDGQNGSAASTLPVISPDIAGDSQQSGFLSSEETDEPTSVLATGATEAVKNILPGANTLKDVAGSDLSAGDEKAAPHVLVITARKDCWIRAIADPDGDADKTVRLLRPGQSVSVPFTAGVQLRLGNAGGIDLLLDGAPYAFAASSGEVKTLDITAGGV